MAVFKYTSSNNINFQKYIYGYCSGIGYINFHKNNQFSKIYPSDLSYLTFMISKSTHSIKFKDSSKKILNGVFLYKSSFDTIDIYSNDDNIDYFKVLLHPNCVYQLLGINPSQIEKNIFSLSNKSLLNIFNKMKKTKGHTQRVNLVERYLSLYLKHKSVNKNNSHIINQTLPNTLKLKMSQLEKRTGYSKVWINKKIKKSTGINFQNLKNLQKLNCTLDKINHSLRIRKKMSLSQIALECGYYDQNHFIKSFKRYTKQTPKEYIEKSNQQLIISQKDFSGTLE